ncbi:MAG: hypothetical protein WCE45_05785 [Sedimentisphaerales bacterium]
MADQDNTHAIWLPVIGKALAYLCMKYAEQEGKLRSTLERVEFLEGLGLTGADAAKVAGSTKASVDELRRLVRNKKARKNGARKKKSRR